MLNHKNTHRADINELLTGFFLLKSQWDQFKDSEYIQSVFKAKKKLFSRPELKEYQAQAQTSAQAILDWTNDHRDYRDNKVNSVSWIGSSLSNKNPTPSDLILNFGSKDLGVSLKTHLSNTKTMCVKNAGLGSFSRELEFPFLQTTYDEKLATFIKLFNLPVQPKKRKIQIRALENKGKIQEYGDMALRSLRDMTIDFYLQLGEKQLRKHLAQYWFATYNPSVKPYFICACTTRVGQQKYKTNILDPLNKDRYKILPTRTKLDILPFGQDTLGITSNGLNILKLRFKFTSEKMASSVKICATL